MKLFSQISLSSLSILGVASAFPNNPTTCSSLVSVKQAHKSVQILTASHVQAGSLNISSGSSFVQNSVSLCQVQGIIKYKANSKNGKIELDKSGDDTLQWELFLPDVQNYNGRYLAVGNGGYAGTIDNYTMLEQLNSGHAVAGCDSGHPLVDSENGVFLDNLGETKAWIHDSIAMTTRATRDIVAKYYSQRPKYSYYYGCSTGGAQGYALAQYHPELFDGIYAGSPGNWYSHLILSFLWNGLHSSGSGNMSQDVLSFITEKVVAACDDIDGVKDGLIENPLKCHFDVTSLECGKNQNPLDANSQPVCLTSEQLRTVQQFYEGPKDSRDGREIYPGFNLGSENGWLPQETFLYEAYGTPILQKLVFKDENYDVKTFNWGSDVDLLDCTASPLIDAINPDLSAFVRRNGKLISTQGWADQFNAATWPIQHLDQIQSDLWYTDIRDFIRLFMVPGGGHCGANPLYTHVPGTYHVLDPLVKWVEHGQVPEEILSTAPPDGSNTTRKLCPWPKQARFLGGDQNDWTSYECV